MARRGGLRNEIVRNTLQLERTLVVRIGLGERRKVDLVRTCFKDGKWTVASKYRPITSFCQRKKRAMETTEKVDWQCKWVQGDKEISFPTTYDHHTKQNRVETSGSSLIIIIKMMEGRKEGLDKSKPCCLYGPWPSKPIDQTRNYSYLWACPPVVRYCFVTDWLIDWTSLCYIYNAVFVFFASSLLPID